MPRSSGCSKAFVAWRPGVRMKSFKREASAMNFRMLSIPVVMLVSFGATAAYLVWQQGGWDSLTTASPHAPAEAASARFARTSGPPPSRQPVLAPAPAPAAAGDALPASILLRAKRGVAQAGEYNAFAVNNSSKYLNIDVSVVSASTGRQSSLRVGLEPLGRKGLTAEGLVIGPGDHVTIRSPPLSDLDIAHVTAEQ